MPVDHSQHDLRDACVLSLSRTVVAAVECQLVIDTKNGELYRNGLTNDTPGDSIDQVPQTIEACCTTTGNKILQGNSAR